MARSGWLDSRARSIVFGLTLPFAALRLILSHRDLFLLSLLPTLITLALYAFLITHLQTWLQGALGGYLQSMGWASGWLGATILFIAKLLLIFIGILSFSLIASIAATPFNDFLAEKAERRAAPPLAPAPKAGIAGKLCLIGIDFGKSVFAILVSLFAFFISFFFAWVPGLNFLAMALACFMLSFQYLSYPQTRRGQDFRAGIRFMTQHPFACMGFGSGIFFLFSIPIVSGLSVPLAVVGGTLLFARAETQREDLK